MASITLKEKASEVGEKAKESVVKKVEEKTEENLDKLLPKKD